MKILNVAADIRRVGLINIPQLLKIILLRLDNIDTLINVNPVQSKHLSDNSNNPPPNLTSRSKIFEINNICDIARVCLVYETPDVAAPKIFLLEMETFKWQFLAESFTEYLRMTVAHLGLPYWELVFSSCGLPSWTEQLFLLIAPHLLEKNDIRRGRNIPIDQELPPFNTLDSAIFRTKQRCNRPLPKTR